MRIVYRNLFLFFYEIKGGRNYAETNGVEGDAGIDTAGKKAREFVEIENRSGLIKEQIDNIKIDLVELFKKENRTYITVDGVTISYSHFEKDQIKTKRPE